MQKCIPVIHAAMYIYAYIPHGTKTTTIIVKKLISASEVEKNAVGGYCSMLRRVALHLLFRHQVTRERAVPEAKPHKRIKHK